MPGLRQCRRKVRARRTPPSNSQQQAGISNDSAVSPARHAATPPRVVPGIDRRLAVVHTLVSSSISPCIDFSGACDSGERKGDGNVEKWQVEASLLLHKVSRLLLLVRGAVRQNPREEISI